MREWTLLKDKFDRSKREKTEYTLKLMSEYTSSLSLYSKLSKDSHVNVRI